MPQSVSKKQRTQWTAQFLAASELVRHGYVVSFTMGNNTPVADLMVAQQDGSSPFWVDVKGVASNSAWFVKRRDTLKNLHYILVRVGETRAEDIFFILTHEQINGLISTQDEIGRQKGHRDVGGGFLWSAPSSFKDFWGTLPGWSSLDQ